MRETFSPTGRLSIRLIDPRSGAIVLEQRVNNLVTLEGRLLLAGLFSGITDVRPPALIQIVVGGALDVIPEDPTLQDTALQDPHDDLTVDAVVESSELSNIEGTPRIVTTLTATLEADPAGTDRVLTEAGVLLTPEGSAPVLYNRVKFGAITKSAALQMTLSWEVIF